MAIELATDDLYEEIPRKQPLVARLLDLHDHMLLAQFGPTFPNLIKEAIEALTPPQDTYDLQADLMARSGQDLPEQVYITPQAIMYFALNLEELGETATALGDAIHEAPTGSMHIAHMSHMVGFSKAADDMILQGSMLKNYGKGLRNLVAEHFGQALPRLAISLAHAVEIADGCVDVAVVNAGLTLSLGLPGKECYDNVVLSNLSKQQDDGVIHKYPDGKWIKGPNYKEPQLASIVEPLLWKPEA